MGIAVVHNFDERSCVDELYKAIFNINHTGQEHCGIATIEDGKLTRVTENGLVRQLKIPKDMKGNRGVGNVSKFGDHQPLILNAPSKMPRFALTFDGFITNRDELRKNEGYLSRYDPELAGRIICQGKDIVNGIQKLSDEIKGFFCIGILTEDGESYIARSPLGTRTLMLGEAKDGYAALTESRAFRKIGIKSAKDVEPGEILMIGDYVLKPAGRMKAKHGPKLCSFLHGYYSWIDSVVAGIPVSAVRERAMSKLAEKDKEEGLEVDIATSIEDSGKAYGEGYGLHFGIPHLSTLIKYPYWVRSYDRPEGERDKEASGKISSVDARLKGRRIVICDDSIRRGTVFKEGPIKYAIGSGAEEIHIRIGTPKNTHYCRLDFQDKPDATLLANRYATDEEIAEFYGVKSIRFPTVDEFVEAIEECAREYGSSLTRKDLCLGCYTGDFDFLK